MYTVLGAAGNIGSVITKTLLEKGEKVRVVGRNAARLEQFVRKGAEAPLRVRNAHGAQHVERPAVGFGTTDAEMMVNDVRDLAADRQDRVELGTWVGDDHRQLAAQDGSTSLIVETRQVAAVEQHAAALDDARRRHQP